MIRVRHAVAVAGLGVTLGFLGGVWFVASGLAFEYVAPPSVTPADPTTAPRAPLTGPPRPAAVSVPKVENFSGGSAGLGRSADRVDLTPAPGTGWEIDPRPLRYPAFWHSTNRHRALGGEVSVDAATGGLHFLLIQSTRQREAPIELRPVFFDERAKRYAAEKRGANASRSSDGAFLMTEFVLDKDPVRSFDPASVRYFGIERVTPDADRALAEAAQTEARAAGLSILPPPTLGAAYKFDLPTADGGRARAEDFRGKVLLVAVWGPAFGGRSGSELAHVNLARKADPPDQLAVLGVSFDALTVDARKAFENVGGADTLVVVPNDPEARRLWADGARIDRLPVYLLIDREGVLRFSCRWNDLRDRIDTLFGRTKRPFPTRTLSKTPAAKPTPKPGASLPPGAPAVTPPGARR